jgi:hypothetical protein
VLTGLEKAPFDGVDGKVDDLFAGGGGHGLS